MAKVQAKQKGIAQKLPAGGKCLYGVIGERARGQVIGDHFDALDAGFVLADQFLEIMVGLGQVASSAPAPGPRLA